MFCFQFCWWNSATGKASEKIEKKFGDRTVFSLKISWTMNFLNLHFLGINSPVIFHTRLKAPCTGANFLTNFLWQVIWPFIWVSRFFLGTLNMYQPWLFDSRLGSAQAGWSRKIAKTKWDNLAKVIGSVLKVKASWQMRDFLIFIITLCIFCFDLTHSLTNEIDREGFKDQILRRLSVY